MKDNRKLIQFVGITYLLTPVFHILLQRMGGASNPSTMSLLGIPMILPLISVIIVKVIHKEKPWKGLGLSFKPNRWFLYAVLTPVLMGALINIAYGVLQGGLSSNITSFINGLAMNLIIGVTLAGVSALLEELAWRGFLFEGLKSLGLFKSFAMTGLLWAVWHIPVAIWYKYPDHPWEGALVNCLLMFVLSISISYVRYKSASVIPAALFHGLLNTLFLSASAIPNGGGFYGEFIKIAAGIVTAVIFISYEAYSRKKANKIEQTVCG